MYTILYFSPTGNAKYLAKKLATHLDSFGVEIYPLEFVKLTEVREGTNLILLYPIHGFNAPRTVKRFVKNLPPKLFKNVNLIGVGSSNNWMNEAASSDLRKHLKRKEYAIGIDEILAMPLTIFINFPKELNQKLIAESEKKIQEISKSLINGEITRKQVEFRSRIINQFGKGESFAARLFGLELYAGKACDSCGICWKNCPERNITENKNGKPKFGFKCSMCMRCIYFCPQKTIAPRFSKFVPIKNGYSISKYLTE